MCVFRVTGQSFNPKIYLQASGFEVCGVFEAGEPRFLSRPDGDRCATSGFTVSVSDAEWTELSQQIADACAFLDQHALEIRKLGALETVEDMRLDFPIELRIGRNDVVAQFDYFPPELVKRAGDLSVGIELSTYSCSDDGEYGA